MTFWDSLKELTAGTFSGWGGFFLSWLIGFACAVVAICNDVIIVVCR